MLVICMRFMNDSQQIVTEHTSISFIDFTIQGVSNYHNSYGVKMSKQYNHQFFFRKFQIA